MNLENIMTKDIITADIKETIFDISKKMQEYDIGFLPISEENKIIGVITDRDIIVKAISNNEDISTSIDPYITRNIISIDVKKSNNDCLELMSSNKIKRVIITEHDKVVGIISLSDLLHSDCNNELLIKTLKEIYQTSSNNSDYEPKVNDFYL